MKKKHKGLLSIILSAAAFAAFLATSTVSAVEGKSLNEPLVEGNTAFALKLYGELGSKEGNLFFSPFSISSALSMTYGGARGNTAEEMKKVVHFQLDQANLHSAFKHLNHELAASARNADQKLTIANGLCLTGDSVSNDFKTMLKDNYDAEIFSGRLDTINSWVKKKTEGKIEKILENLSSNSVCVLLNAIHFKGTWESQFKKTSTHDAPFNVSADKQVAVPLMFQKNDFQILDKEDFQAALLPYKKNLMSMIILLPREADGLAKLEKQLSLQNVRHWLAELEKAPAREIELYLPEYKLETGYDLVPPCKAMGMKDAFDTTGKADFSGMGWPKGNLWISQIKHKAFVEVNEEGAEAGAATAVEMGTTCARTYPVFRADHPFLFLIRDNQTGSILFMGRMVNPDMK